MAKLLNQPAKASESPLLATESPRSENSEKVFKKRKTKTRLNTQVLLCSPSSAVNDGYSWRKYGQKVILGSKFHRAYYRCSHRDTLGCPATKQVQRSDDDSSLFQISLHGDHTCGNHHCRRIPELPSELHNTSPEAERLMIVSGDLQPGFSLTSPSICGPSNDISAPNLRGSGSEMAEMLSGASWTMSESPIENWDFKDDFDTLWSSTTIESTMVEFGAEFPFDFS
ncbi:putative WRKY transcription factor 53 [Dendrobium catenatum]|uniref:Putative WRKY transcription factor 53 n=2 Tax=Dendrobium catenatum TaxID=906689 RepID=A0A2I0XBL9_9ASPA|nr:putative WRKY transcription factor 53 [Dendrobium catenatum]